MHQAKGFIRREQRVQEILPYIDSNKTVSLSNDRLGGAIYIGSATDCTFTANKGSAIYNGNAIGCAFTGNSANTGGAIYNEGAAEIKRCINKI